jgi:hypothetical protein
MLFSCHPLQNVILLFLLYLLVSCPSSSSSLSLTLTLPASLTSLTMARPRLPPTPAMSGEFTVSDKPLPAEGSDAFVLPPAALAPAPARDFRPASPTSPDLVASRHNPTTSQTKSSRGGTSTKHRLDDLDLPPPPTRSRKIIQMKPKTPAQPQQAQSKASGGKQAKENNNASSNNAKGSKKKQPGATNASGRKMARKTAHSLIERRRRSKMNEEFGTLKDMIPACRGQEMHKLAILQVGPPSLLLAFAAADLIIPGEHRLRQLPGAVHPRHERPGISRNAPPAAACAAIPNIRHAEWGPRCGGEYIFRVRAGVGVSVPESCPRRTSGGDNNNITGIQPAQPGPRRGRFHRYPPKPHLGAVEGRARF